MQHRRGVTSGGEEVTLTETIMALLPKISSSGVFWLVITLGLYFCATEVHRLAGKRALLNPTMLTIVGVSGLLIALDVPHAQYFSHVSILHYLLGAAIVALAVPLHRNLATLSGTMRRNMAGLVAASLTSICSGLLIAQALGASNLTLLSLAPKSATTAVSMDVALGIGGDPALTACLTILTGIIGATFGPYLLNWSGTTVPQARGVALGTASHGIATARAFTEGEMAGCCASLAMGLNAILTALFAPFIVTALRIGI
jgi:putative effector of murein hydrolase